MNLYPKKVYVNGEIVDAKSAKISVFDRGFLFGDGIYEVMVQINGRFFYGDEHIKRLQFCVDKINIQFDATSLTDEIPKLLTASELQNEDCLLYIQVTRGTAPRTHAYPKNVTPTVMMYVVPKKLPDINLINASVVTTNDYRWEKCDIKMTSLLGNVMANDFAMEKNCFETVFVRDGIITEASHCNVFFVKDNVVFTHPANEFILNGITRQIVLDLCRKLNLKVVEKGIQFSDLSKMDEAFLTGTSTQIAAIRQMNNHSFYKNDEIGTITKKLQQAYFELK
ncbi:aminotransferase class IV [Polaribacter gochangensis]|uniref:aminotransferase class IV n=1 Tax=Polaribacter gochangensis TaxID=3252903 RepID=UPI003904A530